jgi:Na+/alanine symporter
MVFPFYWMLTSALKTRLQVSQFPPQFAPDHWLNFENFRLAFNTAPFAQYFLNSLIVCFFSVLIVTFTTILGWAYYGESALNYLRGGKSKRLYQFFYIASVFVGSIVSLDIIWNFADSMNALMAIPNLIALLLLSKVAAQETKKYLWSNRLDDWEEDTPIPGV